MAPQFIRSVDRGIRSASLSWALLCLLVFAPVQVQAFAFLRAPQFASDGSTSNDWGRLLWNPANIQVQPNGDRNMVLNYDFGGAGQQFVFRDNTGKVIADLRSRAWGANERAEVQRAVGVWNAAAARPHPGALLNNVLPDIPTGRADLRTTAQHEIGHALGLGHPNLGRLPGTPASLRTYVANHTPQGTRHLHAGQDTVFGTADDVTLPGPDGVYGTADDQSTTDVLHNLTYAGLLRGPATPTQTPVVQWTQTVTEPQPGKLRRNLPGTGATEAVMVQGGFRDEFKTGLASDDYLGLRALQSGADFYEGANPATGTNDDFTFRLSPRDTTATEINFWDVDLKGFLGATRNVGVIPARGGAVAVLLQQLLPTVEFPTDELLAISLVWSTSEGVADIVAADILIDTSAHRPVPVSATLPLLMLGFLGLIHCRARYGARASR